MVIAEVACLAGAPARSGDVVPAFGQVCVGAAGERVAVDDRPAPAQGMQCDGVVRGAGQLDVRHPPTRDMSGRAVVLGDRQVLRGGGSVAHGAPFSTGPVGAAVAAAWCRCRISTARRAVSSSIRRARSSMASR